MNHTHNSDFPLVVVLSGPSGVGKDATISAIKDSGNKFHFVTTATTRLKRENEIDGVDYHFLTIDDFTLRIANDEFIEYARVYGNYYGVLKSEISNALQNGHDVIMRVDIQGAATLKKHIPMAVLIFLMPPSMEDLIARLNNRNTDSIIDQEIRINKATEELQSVSEFDYAIINHNEDLASTAIKVISIICAEKCRVNRRQTRII